MRHILSLLCILLFACNEKKDTTKEDILNNDTMIKESAQNKQLKDPKQKMNEKEKLIENVLIKQLKQGAAAENEVISIYDFFDYNEDDLKAAAYLQKDILNKNGIDLEHFKDRIKEIFGNNSEENYLYFNLVYRDANVGFKGKETEFRGMDTYIIKDMGIIIKPLFIPEIIDYQTQYPHLIDIEESVKTEYLPGETVIIPNKNRTTYVVEENSFGDSYVYFFLWKDIEDLEEQRKENIDLLLNRHRYLFLDDKSKLPWLIQNDNSFLCTLVLEGYLKDKKLLLNALNYAVSYEKLQFWIGAIAFNTYSIIRAYPTPEFSYEIREEVLNFIIKNDDGHLPFCSALLSHIDTLLKDKYTFDDILEVVAHTLNTILLTEQHHNTFVDRVGMFYQEYPEVIEKLRQKDFYNLPVLEHYTTYEYVNRIEFGELAGVYGESTAKTMDLGTDEKIVTKLKEDLAAGIYGKVDYIDAEEEPSALVEKLVQKEDLEDVSKTDLRIQRNAIFARKGYIFKSGGEMDTHFRATEWYTPISKNVHLDYIEKKNVALLKLYEE